MLWRANLRRIVGCREILRKAGQDWSSKGNGSDVSGDPEAGDNGKDIFLSAAQESSHGG